MTSITLASIGMVHGSRQRSAGPLGARSEISVWWAIGVGDERLCRPVTRREGSLAVRYSLLRHPDSAPVLTWSDPPRLTIRWLLTMFTALSLSAACTTA
jgi:hypothetical protein